LAHLVSIERKLITALSQEGSPASCGHQRKVNKTRELSYNNFEHCVITVVGVPVKKYRKGWQNINWTFLTRKVSLVYHFHISSQEFPLATSQARQRAACANSLVTLLLSLERLSRTEKTLPGIRNKYS
jgi:hypothetical protein